MLKRVALLAPPIRALYDHRNQLALDVQRLKGEVDTARVENAALKAEVDTARVENAALKAEVEALRTATERIKNERMREALLASPPNYNRFHALTAVSYQPVAGRSVLVVGCNRGDDCRHFVEFDAAVVIGIDIMVEIGISFSHRSVAYCRASADSMPFSDGKFDFIFCFATMEHVGDIKSAFGEMARVCRPGGLIYSVAAPLWNCRQGPHWGDAFNDYPWIHLRLSPNEIIEFSERRHELNRTLRTYHQSKFVTRQTYAISTKNQRGSMSRYAAASAT
jgi:SAM-dependent methyltransferase